MISSNSVFALWLKGQGLQFSSVLVRHVYRLAACAVYISCRQLISIQSLRMIYCFVRCQSPNVQHGGEVAML